MALTVLSTLQFVYGAGQGTTLTKAIPIHGWKGYPLGIQTNSEPFMRPGQTGSGRQITNRRGSAQTFYLVVGCTNLIQASEYADMVNHSKGYKVSTDSDPWGYAWTAWVDGVALRPMACAGDGCAARLEIDLTVELMS